MRAAGVWALDMDGVVWLARQAIPGAAEAVAALRRAGKRPVFLTNNSGPRLDEHVAALAAIDIEAQGDDIATSAQAAARLLRPGQRVALVGDEGARQALADAGTELVSPAQRPDVVVVGRTVDLDYDELAAAATAVRQGARFLATNTDATFPAGHGLLLPGAGALVAFLSTASGRQPEVAGKPHEPMAALVKERYGRLEMMVGDRPDTDGRFARLVGAPFGLVLTGVTAASDLPVDPAPDCVGRDLASLVRTALEGAPARY